MFFGPTVSLGLVLSFSLALMLASGVMGADNARQAALMGQRGCALLSADRDKEGADYLYRAAQLDPNNAAIQYNLAVAFSRLKRPQEAWKAASRAVRLDPNNWHAWRIMGGMYGECGDKANAIKTLTDAKRRFASNGQAVAELNEELASFQGSAAIASSGNSNAHWALAQKFYQAEKFADALKEFQIAFKLDPTNSKLLNNIMVCQTKVGDLEGLQESRKMFLAKFPTHSEAATMQEAIKYYDEDFKSTRQREANQSATDQPSRFASVPMPLKVYVHNRLSGGRTVWSNNPAAAKDKINYSVLVERAFTEWSNAAGKKITFIFVDNPGVANVECEWTEDRAKLHYGFAGGVTSYTTNVNGQPKARIYLLIDYSNPAFNESEFYLTSLHEIGHALGLSHSSSPKDIMYFSSGASSSKMAPSLSPGDIQRVRKLYNVY